MKYAQSTGRSYATRRRRRRSMVVLLAVAVAVALGSIYAAAYFTGALPGSRPPQKPASCTPTSTSYASADFVVNIYNASSGQGKAKETARALKANHFQVGVISNDPYKMKLLTVGQIRFGPKGADNARRFVQPLVPKAQLLADGRDDDSVDLVLGDAFPELPSPSPTPSTTPPGC